MTKEELDEVHRSDAADAQLIMQNAGGSLACLDRIEGRHREEPRIVALARARTDLQMLMIAMREALRQVGAELP